MFLNSDRDNSQYLVFEFTLAVNDATSSPIDLTHDGSGRTREVEGSGSAWFPVRFSEIWVIIESLDFDSGIGGMARFSGGRILVSSFSPLLSITGLDGGTTTSVCVRG